MRLCIEQFATLVRPFQGEIDLTSSGKRRGMRGGGGGGMEVVRALLARQQSVAPADQCVCEKIEVQNYRGHSSVEINTIKVCTTRQSKLP